MKNTRIPEQRPSPITTPECRFANTSGVQDFYTAVFIISFSALLSSCGSQVGRNESLTAATTLKTSDEDRVAKIAKGFNLATIDCPQRIWPHYDWSRKKIYITNQATNKAFAWQGGRPLQNRVSTVDLSSLSPDFTQGLYGFSMKEPDAMGLSLDKSTEYQEDAERSGKPDFVLTLGLHEGFHHFAQKGWKSPGSEDVNASRAVDYPVLAEPRYLRGKLLKHVKAYLKNPSDKGLREARGLYDLYEQKYPTEAKAIASTDQVEGTAFYAELVGTAITELGCGAVDKDLIANAAKELDTRSDISGSSDSESYSLGAAAGLIMRMTGDYAGWEKKIPQGTTPLALLFENIAPETAPDDPELRREADQIIKQENQRYAPNVRTFLASLKDPEAVAIHMKSYNTVGSYGTQGFIRHRGTGKELTLDFGGTISASGNPGATVKISGLTLENLDQSDGCGSDGFVAYVPKKHVKLDQGTVSLDAPTISGKNVPMTAKKDATGREWVCIP